MFLGKTGRANVAKVRKEIDECVVRAKVSTFHRSYQAESASDAIHFLIAIQVP